MSDEVQGDDPRESAERFAEEMRALGYRLDFSWESLDNEIDRLFDLPVATGKENKAQWRFEADLGAYIGESHRV